MTPALRWTPILIVLGALGALVVGRFLHDGRGPASGGAHDVELVREPEVARKERVEDERACFGSHVRVSMGDVARWRWPGAKSRRVLAIYAPRALGGVGYRLDGNALPEVDLAPGWNRLAYVPGGDAEVVLELVGREGGWGEAAALVPADVSMNALGRYVLDAELESLRAVSDWSVALAEQKKYADNPIVGCSKHIPADDVCPHWRIDDRSTDENLHALWKKTYAARGYVFDPRAWNAATLRCKDKHGLATSACLSCSAALPEFVAREGIVPIGVYHPVWCSPFAGSQCGTCMKIHFPVGDPSPKCTPKSADLFSHCPSVGALDYPSFAAQRGEFEVRVRHDERGPYVIGYVTEWFDNIAGPYRSLPFSIDFATHTGEVDKLGNFPVEYDFIACPTSDDRIGYLFVDVREDTTSERLPWLKLRAMNTRFPVEKIELRLDDGWHAALPVADGHWQLMTSVMKSARIGVRTTMYSPSGDPVVRTVELAPEEGLCLYQDPDCRPLLR